MKFEARRFHTTHVWSRSPLLGDADAYKTLGLPAHNLVIDWAAIYGLLGLLSALLLAGVIVREGLHALRGMRGRGIDAQAIALLGLSAIALARFFSTGGATFSPAMWMAVGYILMARPSANLDVVDWSPCRRRRQVVHRSRR